jgi:hypothetical protein
MTIYDPSTAKASTTLKAMTELTTTIAAYNLVSRFLEALHVDPEPN